MIDDPCQLSIGSAFNYIIYLFFNAGLFKDYWYYLNVKWTCRILEPQNIYQSKSFCFLSFFKNSTDGLNEMGIVMMLHELRSNSI